MANLEQRREKNAFSDDKPEMEAVEQFENLEQKRAKNAFSVSQETSFGGKNAGEVVKKIPAMICESGFLGALAFAMDTKEKTDSGREDPKKGYRDVFDAIRKHLISCNMLKEEVNNCKDLMCHLCNGETSKLRLVTTESMAYLNYLRRFAKKDIRKGSD